MQATFVPSVKSLIFMSCKVGICSRHSVPSRLGVWSKASCKRNIGIQSCQPLQTSLPLPSCELLWTLREWYSWFDVLCECFLVAGQTFTGCICHILSFILIIDNHALSWYRNIDYSTTCTKIFDVLGTIAKGNREWRFLGKVTHPKCMSMLIGIRSGRFSTAGSGHLDRRFGNFGVVTQLSTRKYLGKEICYGLLMCLFTIQSQKLMLDCKAQKRTPVLYMKLDKYFLELYIGAAGMLPDRFLGCNG